MKVANENSRVFFAARLLREQKGGVRMQGFVKAGTALCFIVGTGACGPPAGTPDAPSHVERLIEAAAQQYDVPGDLLAAHAWSVSRLRMSSASDPREHHHATPTFGVNIKLYKHHIHVLRKT